jgi:hypothetical protein
VEALKAMSAWFNAIVAAIKTLPDAPQRCPLAEESQHFQAEVRLLLYGKLNRRYKIYSAIHKTTGTIRAFHVRHWARKPAGTGELDDLMDYTAEQDGA